LHCGVGDRATQALLRQPLLSQPGPIIGDGA